MADNSLNSYLDEIGRQQLLSNEQERQLSERIMKGDSRAIGQLVEANLRFVVKVATAYRGQGLGLDDLVSEGNIGMMMAAAKFDASHGSRFISYAAPYVRRAIERAIEQQNGVYRQPKDAPERERRYDRTLSVDAPLGRRTGMSLLSVLVNPNATPSDERVYSEAVENAIEMAMLSLSERESQVISRFYGLQYEHETMAEIADDLGLKRERVRQIRNHAVRKLRKAYRKKLRDVAK